MSTFHALVAGIKDSCDIPSWELLPADKIPTLAQKCGPREIAELIQELDALDDADLEGDAGDGIDDYWRLRTFFSQVLAQIGEPAVPQLIEALKSDNPKTRGYVARSLGLIGTPQAIDPIVRLLETESDFDTKLFFITALGEIGDPRVVEVLLPYLHPPEQQNRHAIIDVTVQALGRIGTEEVLRPLFLLWEFDPDPYVRQRAADALNAITNRHNPSSRDSLR
jgi:HEAT repeat protein